LEVFKYLKGVFHGDKKEENSKSEIGVELEKITIDGEMQKKIEKMFKENNLKDADLKGLVETENSILGPEVTFGSKKTEKKTTLGKKQKYKNPFKKPKYKKQESFEDPDHDYYYLPTYEGDANA